MLREGSVTGALHEVDGILKAEDCFHILLLLTSTAIWLKPGHFPKEHLSQTCITARLTFKVRK